MDLHVKLKIMKVLEENVGSQFPFFPFFWSEGSIFFQTPLLACPGCPESVASWLGLDFLVWGRENKKMKKLGILRGPSSQSSGQRGLLLELFLSTLAVQSLNSGCLRVWGGEYGIEKARTFAAIWIGLQDLISLPDMPAIIYSWVPRCLLYISCPRTFIIIFQIQ